MTNETDAGEMDRAEEKGSDLAVIDHVGIALWRAARRWRSRMAAEMAARGYPWHQSAAGEVLAHLGPDGLSQRALTERMGMSKQAVQQLVDQLEVLDVVRRVPDPTDKRARRIELTELGARDFAERNRVKVRIEAEYRQRLGEDAFKALLAALAELNT
ncbi:MarR family winged helix-turn-helix transcriptional regulator [Cucumibacter marinus]|uniref:MarR family winged helix-turn-helix transcriptional regulator n=1 Tax=Cucumibacter marinus TaxID=1121252 RepID=UPI00138B0C29|nr:MarR family transcriptional regulator [Cucumibacter marinus]